MTLLRSQCELILNQALESKVGIVCRILPGFNVTKEEAKLYRFRKELGNPELLNLIIKLSPENPDNEIWILRGDLLT